MKTFILSVYKYKKWIILGLSILYLLLFCFPIISVPKSYNETTLKITYMKLPFIVYLAQFWIYFIPNIKNIANLPSHNLTKALIIKNFSVNLTCAILMLACFIFATICIIRQFRGKKFQFVWSVIFAFLTMLIYGIDCFCSYSQGVEEIKYYLHFYPTTYIFLALLILDIVYLVLEWYYVHNGEEKLTAKLNERKAVKQAKQAEEYKQSPEYRIEQLEKELQELKAKSNESEDNSKNTD